MPEFPELPEVRQPLTPEQFMALYREQLAEQLSEDAEGLRQRLDDTDGRRPRA